MKLKALFVLLCCLVVPCSAIDRNTAGQSLELMVVDRSTGGPKTGDAANLTFYVSIDGDTTPDLITDNTQVEVSSTNAPGVYRVGLSAGETNGTNIVYSGKSSTSNIDVVPRFVVTLPAGFSSSVSQTGNNYSLLTNGTYGLSNLKTLLDNKPDEDQFMYAAEFFAESAWSTLQTSVDNIPTSIDFESFWGVNVSELGTANSIGKLFVDRMPTAGTLLTDLDAQDLTPAPIVPVNQVPVPASRTWVLEANGTALQAGVIKGYVGDPKLFAIDYRNDLPTNGRLIDVEEVTIVSATDGGDVDDGLVFDLDGADTCGVDKSQAKITIECVTSGVYTIDVVGRYRDADGGGTSRGRVKLTVVE